MQVSNTLGISDLKTVSTQSVPPIDRSRVPAALNSSTNVTLAPDVVTFSSRVPLGESSDLITPVSQPGNTPDLSPNANQINPNEERQPPDQPITVDGDVISDDGDSENEQQQANGNAVDDESQGPDSSSNSTSNERPGSSEDEGFSPQEQKQIQELAARDAEVKSHERAHQAVGGQYAGSISYTFQTGPDGKRYAIGGEVPIDVAPVAGDPQATIDKMRTVRAAALAPSEPSAQDRSVASSAQRLLVDAQIELAEQKREERAESQEKIAENFEQANRAIEVYEGFIGIGTKEVDPKDLIDELV